ncbi:hypothetical protein LINPERHAP1_LOCUS24 [Linum perenne]
MRHQPSSHTSTSHKYPHCYWGHSRSWIRHLESRQSSHS